MLVTGTAASTSPPGCSDRTASASFKLPRVVAGRHIVVTSELRTPAGSGRDGEAFRALDGWTAIVLRGDDIATPMLDY